MFLSRDREGVLHGNDLRPLADGRGSNLHKLSESGSRTEESSEAMPQTGLIEHPFRIRAANVLLPSPPFWGEGPGVRGG